MNERTTSAGTKMQPLLSDSSFRAITCKACNRICSSLAIENPFTGTKFCYLYCSESCFCGDCCCILCSKLISLDYYGYNYIRCEATIISGHIWGHVSYLECALRAYMAGRVRGSINLDAKYLCRYCDSRVDLVPHASKLLNICFLCWHRKDFECWHSYFAWLNKKYCNRIVASYWINQCKGIALID